MAYEMRSIFHWGESYSTGAFVFHIQLGKLQLIFHRGGMFTLWNSRLQAGPLRGFNRAGIFHWGLCFYLTGAYFTGAAPQLLRGPDSAPVAHCKLLQNQRPHLLSTGKTHIALKNSSRSSSVHSCEGAEEGTISSSEFWRLATQS